MFISKHVRLINMLVSHPCALVIIAVSCHRLFFGTSSCHRLFLVLPLETHAVAQCLRLYATNRKVAGSISDGVIGIFH
jgi:hypothetical protein